MLKIGLVGAGHIGKIHIEQINSLAAIWEIAGFYDIDESVRENVSKKYHIKAFDTFEDLLGKCDAVDVVCPTVSHYEYAKKALDSGKHIFVEKPVTETFAQANELKKIAQSKNLNIQVGHVERFNPAYISATKQSLNPMFIEAHRLAEFNPRGMDVSVVLDLMIHDIDIVLSMVKSPIKSVNASGVSIVSNNPDIANARIEFENGCTANLTASRISLQKMRKMRIFQKQAYILIDFLNKITEIFSLIPYSDLPSPFTFVIDTGVDKKMVKLDKPEIGTENAIKTEFESFYHSILNQTTPVVDIDAGANALKLAQLIIDQILEKEQKFKLIDP